MADGRVLEAFGCGFHVSEASVEVTSDHLVHGGEDAHELAGEEVHWAVHDPANVCGWTLRFEKELCCVVAFEGLEEVELDGALCGYGGEDLHAALADLAVPFPLVDGAGTAGGAGVGG